MMRSSRVCNFVVAIEATIAVLFGSTLTDAAECPNNPDALGTSRTLVVDPAEHPRLGTIQYHETVPLEDHEVVITFDDGPLPPRSTRVLETLDHECVKATFFLIGKMAHTFPAWVRRIREAGHTIGTHSYSHPLTFHRMPLDKAEFEINQGIAEVTAALGDEGGIAPFFRIPGLLRADGVEHYLASQHIQIWSADEVADDWLKIDSGQVYSRALQRIEANHKGILLLHDIQPRTVEALPHLLRELKRRGYRVVHVVPATPDQPKTVTDPGQWVMHAHLAARTPILYETEPGLPAPSPASFGVDVATDSVTFSFLQRVAAAHDASWQPDSPTTRLPAPLPFQPASTWPNGPEVKSVSSDWPSRFRRIDTRGEPEDVVAVDEIQRLLATLPDDRAPSDDSDQKSPAVAADAPSVSVTLHPQRGPIANAVIPRGPFP
jgi:peptidoglycan-N-acetylglucosamine deacetylase